MSASYPFKLAERLPISYLVLISVSGTMFLLFSSMRFIPQIPQWLTNPFSSSSADSVSNLLAFFFCVAVVGVLLSIFKDSILGNGGLNEKLRVLLRIKRMGSTHFKRGISNEDAPDYVKWVDEERQYGYTDFLNIQYAIVQGIILGTEIVAFLNFFFIFYSIYMCQFLLEISMLFIIPLLICFGFIVYNRRYFRGYYGKKWDGIIDAFYEYKQKKEATTSAS